MEEENQQQVKQVTKEPQRVTTKDPKKVEAGIKRLGAINRKKREAKWYRSWGYKTIFQYYGSVDPL